MEMLKNVKMMPENVKHIWGFITVIVVGLVDAKWILMIDTSCSVVSFRMIRSIVDLCVSSHESV
jgi:hypothetical protein